MTNMRMMKLDTCDIEEKVKDLSFNLEEMEIGEIEDNDEDILKERARIMDEKIKAKDIKDQEKEDAYLRKRKEKKYER